MKPAGLQLEGVVKRFGSHLAVDGVSFRAADGEIVALLGPSGCGKTTTLRLIAGFEKLEAGRIVVAGSDIMHLPPFRRDIGVVFQDYALFPHMTVAQNVDYGMRQHGRPRQEREQRRRELLRLVRLEGLEERRPAALSGGQQQRVALARALAISPKLLLLDEPLSNLDAKLREALRIELREILRAVGMTTLMVTHDQAEAIGIADRIALMNHGRIVQIGAAREIYEEPATRFVAEFVGRSLWFTGKLESDGSAQVRFLADDGLVFVVQRPTVGGMRCGLSIRPEHIHLKPRPEDENKIAAVVERIDFFGAEFILRCRCQPGSRVIALPIRPDDTSMFNVGDRVELGISSARCRVVPDE
jgi:ABC-type Fe3+/spermidine/putrescine transport system ATPase subunit